MSSTVKNIVIVFGVGILLVVLYLVFKPSSEEPSLVSSSSSSQVLPTSNTFGSSVSDPSGEFLPLLLSVQRINLDTSLVEKEAFKALKDNTSDIYGQTPEPGRPNPFAPIGFDNSVSPFEMNFNNQ